MRILFFASIRDFLGSDGEEWSDLEGIDTVQDVVDVLKQRGEPWASGLSGQSLLTAKNHELVSFDTPVSMTDEIALMPPVTGG